MHPPAKKRAFLAVGLALVVAGVWIVRATTPSPAPDEGSGLDGALTTIPFPAPGNRRPSEPPPGDALDPDAFQAPTRPPEPPGPGATKDVLWTYGESYFGWVPAADVDLDEYSTDELAAWVDQDLRLYGRREPGGLGYINYVELDPEQ